MQSRVRDVMTGNVVSIPETAGRTRPGSGSAARAPRRCGGPGAYPAARDSTGTAATLSRSTRSPMPRRTRRIGDWRPAMPACRPRQKTLSSPTPALTLLADRAEQTLASAHATRHCDRHRQRTPAKPRDHLFHANRRIGVADQAADLSASGGHMRQLWRPERPGHWPLVCITQGSRLNGTPLRRTTRDHVLERWPGV
jgi:hypothetical protein